MFKRPPVTQSIIIANVPVFLLARTLGNNSLISVFALWPLGSQLLVSGEWRHRRTGACLDTWMANYYSLSMSGGNQRHSSCQADNE